jgi:bla regulator protein blaR1
MTTWLIEALIGATLLMLLVLAVRRPVARLWGAHCAYALWALPLTRMILPGIPGWQPLYVPVAAARPQGDFALAVMPPADAAAYTQPLPVAGPEIGLIADWPMLLLALWAVGTGVFLMVQWSRHLRFVGRAVAGGKRLMMVGHVEVIVSPHVPGPMAAGLLRRRILLPADFAARYAPEERRLALLHEAAHHDRLDLAANLAGLLVLAAHWWNPIAHAAWRAFRADQELACDATVLAGCTPDVRAAYGQAVLKSACVATPVAACAMNHKSQLKDRIAMMKLRNFGRTRRIAGGLSVAALVAAGLIATASGAQAPAPISPPAPPVPPAPAVAPAPPAAPMPPRVVVLKQELDAKGGKPGTVKVIVTEGGSAAFDKSVLEAELADGVAEKASDVDVTQTPDGRRMVMIRRHAMAAEKGAQAAERHAAEAHKMASVHIAQVKADMRARCDKDGIKLPAEADIAQLATCGIDIQKQVREAIASARIAIAESRSLSAEQREKALKGLDQAVANQRRDITATLER